MFGSNHTVRNTLGAAVVGGAAMFSAFSAAGQQVASHEVQEQRAAYLATQCDHVRDADLRVGCRAEASIRFHETRAAAAKNESAALRTENTCQQTLIGMIQNGKRDAVRAAYAGRPVNSVSACDILNALTKG